ncbi:MAG: winged helix DNA-binding domain-containing protein [Arachnia sp.]
MPDARLARARLVAQGLVTRPYATPTDAVTGFAAMQGQDLPGAIASAALRVDGGTVQGVLDDMVAGRLVRGYPMRGTVFLMPAADVTWVTELCAAPAVRAARARRHSLDLEQAHLDEARAVAERALADGPISRAALFALWDGIFDTRGGRGYHVLTALISETVLCCGPWNGSEQDVASAAQWLPAGRTLAERFDGERIPAVAELLRRYLTAHGPATIRDFAWWTKLPLGEIRRALPLVAPALETDGAAEPSYWRPGLLDEVAALGRSPHAPLLLPGFDEFVLGYQDRTFAMTDDEHQRIVPGNNGMFRRTVVVGGLVTGTWARSGRPGRRTLAIEEFTPLSDARRRRLDRLFDAFPFVGE